MQNINDLLQNKYQDQNLEEEQFGESENFNDEATPQLVEVERDPVKEEEMELNTEEPMAEEVPENEPIAVSEDKEDKEPQVSASKFVIIREIIENIKNELSKVGELLAASVPEKDLEEVSKKLTITKASRGKEEFSQMRVIEGVFDGQNMVGGDGEHYTVPANYASKSKLVEGDLLKLTILHDGSFVYKQIAPIERRRVVGALAYEEASDQYYILAESRRWKVLRASITYYKGEPGDEVTIVIPKDTPSQWAAVENIIKK